jgi:polyhydroxyalkanoate synthesis regulator phasin
MVREALTGYWSLVSGLTEVTLERARTAAKQLAAQGDATRDQVAGLAQEIAETGKANREALVKLIRYETERAAGRLGFASSDEVSTLQGRVRELERSIAELRAAADKAGTGPESRPESRPAAAPAPKKASAKKAAAKAAPAKAAKAAKAPKAPAKKATPRKRTAAAVDATGPGTES